MPNKIAQLLMKAHREPFSTEYDHRELLKMGADEIRRLERHIVRLNRLLEWCGQGRSHFRFVAGLARVWIMGEKFPKQARPTALEMVEKIDRELARYDVASGEVSGAGDDEGVSS